MACSGGDADGSDEDDERDGEGGLIDTDALRGETTTTSTSTNPPRSLASGIDGWGGGGGKELRTAICHIDMDAF